MQRPLRERRERAHLLDLVAEQLHPQRLAAGGREDVDDAAAHGELAALVDAIDALVAGARESRREAVEARLRADVEPHGLGAGSEGRHSLGEGGGRRADEAAGGEDVESPRPLADEVRRRLEPGCVRDAAAREQRDAVGAEEPRRALGRVPRIRVLGEEDQQPSPELLVQRREDERERRLGDARPAGQRLHERLESLGCRELRDEGVERSLVHANGGKRAPRGPIL